MVSNTAVSDQLSQIYSIYFTLLLNCFLEHKQVLSDPLRWTNYKVGTRSTTEESTNKKERERVSVGEKLKHLIKSTTASVNCNLSVSLSLLIASSMRFCSHATWRGKQFFFSCYHVCRMPCYSASQSTIRSRRNRGEEMAAGQVHDIHYWLDYNEQQGNNSEWCLCIDDFKPRTICTSHTDTE